MKKVILGLIALSTVSTLALPVQAKTMPTDKNPLETESINQLKGRKKPTHHPGRYRYQRVCRFRHGRKVCHIMKVKVRR